MTYLVINQIAMGNSTQFGTESIKLDFIYVRDCPWTERLWKLKAFTEMVTRNLCFMHSDERQSSFESIIQSAKVQLKVTKFYNDIQ